MSDSLLLHPLLDGSDEVARVRKGGGGSSTRFTQRRAAALTGTSLLLATAIVLGVVLSGTRAAAGTGAGVTWKNCPPGEPGRECASLQLPLDPDHPSKGNVTAFVRRLFSGAAATGNALWMLEGGPGFSAEAFSGAAEYFVGRDPNITVYLQDQRGVGRSSGINCGMPPRYNFDPQNASVVADYAACNADVVAAYGDRAQYFGTYYAAQDYKAVVDAVAPDRVSMYALSYGTFLLNAYLLVGGRADALVMDGPVPPTRWVLENNAAWTSRVAEDVLDACAAASPTCRRRLGEPAHTPRLVMDAIVDGTLPCLAKLPWLTQQRAAAYTAFMAASQFAHVLMGPFWDRLSRCSASDVDQLNFFDAYRQALEPSGPIPPAYNYGLSLLIGTSELYSYAVPPAAPLTYEQQVAQSTRRLSSAGVELLVSYARDVSKVPLYPPHPAIYRRFAILKAPLLMLVGTLDPQTPHGLGRWFAAGLGPNTRLVTVPFAAHGTLNPGDPCVLEMVSDYLTSFGARTANASCLERRSPPDFEGLTKDVQGTARDAFGTDDLWNVGG